MKVIGAGLPRTATLTQRTALEMLGLGPCHHMNNLFADPASVTQWRRVLDGELPARELLSGFQSVVDWPGSYYYRDLMEDYPDAKVLLSTRSGDSWAKSMRETIWGFFYGDVLMRHLSDARACVDPVWNTYVNMMKDMWHSLDLLEAEETTDEFMATAFDRYVQSVKDYVPAERLLTWSPKDGWEPLCDFLEVPVPGEPVPHVNDGGEFADRLSRTALTVVNEKLAVA